MFLKLGFAYVSSKPCTVIFMFGIKLSTFGKSSINFPHLKYRFAAHILAEDKLLVMKYRYKLESVRKGNRWSSSSEKPIKG